MIGRRGFFTRLAQLGTAVAVAPNLDVTIPPAEAVQVATLHCPYCSAIPAFPADIEAVYGVERLDKLRETRTIDCVYCKRSFLVRWVR